MLLFNMRKLLNFYFIIGFVFLCLCSCENEFEELNQNPFFPTQTEIGPLFNGVVQTLQLGWDEQFYMHNEALYGITQLAALTEEAFQNLSIGTEDVWKDYYTALSNVRALEKRFADFEGDQESLNNVKAQVMILKAYKTFKLTDLFGDVPYFDAGKGFESLEFVEPKFDAQEEIYKAVLADLEWAANNINIDPSAVTSAGQPFVSMGSFDNLFDSNLNLWIKFANSLRLKHSIRMAEVDAAFAEPIIKDILENKLPLIQEGEDVALYPEKLDWQKASTHWSFREHNNLRIGSNIWNQISDSNDPSGSGIFDPRGFIWFEPNNEMQWNVYPQIPANDTEPSGGFPYEGSRDIAYDVKGQQNIYAPFNYYLIRDDSQIPELLLTAAEVKFLEAEAYERGLGVQQDAGDARSSYALGVATSIRFWQNLVLNTDIWENKPPILSEGEIQSIVNSNPKITIFGNSEPLKLIYTQRWLDNFRQPWEAYALTRRTLATPREGSDIQHFRFAYPPSESINNPTKWAEQVSKMGADNSTTKVWWMN